MRRHRAVSSFVRVVIFIKIHSFSVSFELFDNAIRIFRVVFGNVSFNAGRIKDSNVTVYYGYDICSFNTASNPYRISQVTIKKITRNSTTGFLQWSTGTHTLSGTVFIDASDDGRLTRLVNFGGTVGRYD